MCLFGHACERLSSFVGCDGSYNTTDFIHF